MTRAFAYNNTGGTTGSADAAYAKAHPGTTGFRHFDDAVNKSPIPVADIHKAGLNVYASMKPSVSSPELDAMAAFVKTLIKDDLFTVQHEPEAPKKNIAPADFVTMFQKVYPVMKNANGAVTVLPTHMEYQMRPGGVADTVAKLETWNVGNANCDGRAIDVYCSSWMKLSNGGPMALKDLPGFKLWLPWAQSKGMPIYIAELGCASIDGNGKQVFTDAQRADWYGAAFDYLTQQGVELISPWNGSKITPGDDQFWHWGGSIAFPQTDAVIAQWAASTQQSVQPDVDVDALEKQIADLTAQVADLNGQMSSMTTQLAATQTSLAAAQQRGDNYAQSIGNFKNALANLTV